MTGALVSLREALSKHAARPKRGHLIAAAILLPIAVLSILGIARSWRDYEATLPEVAHLVSVRDPECDHSRHQIYQFDRGTYSHLDRGLITDLEHMMDAPPKSLEALKPGDRAIVWRTPAGQLNPTRPLPVMTTVGGGVFVLLCLLPLSFGRNRPTPSLSVIPKGMREVAKEGKDGRKTYRLKYDRPALLSIGVGIVMLGIMVLFSALLGGIGGIVLRDELMARTFFALGLVVSAMIVPLIALAAPVIGASKVVLGRGALQAETMLSPLPFQAIKGAELYLLAGTVKLSLVCEGMADPIQISNSRPLWVASLLEREGITVGYRE